MRQPKLEGVSKALERFAVWTTRWVGSSWAFMLALALTLGWLVSGLLVSPPYNDTWQLAMNTISSIVTFLMVFLLQRSQNKEALAMQIKLNEIVGAVKGASNRLINVEDLSEEEVRDLHDRYQRLAKRAQRKGEVGQKLSIEQSVSLQDLPNGPEVR